MIKFKTLFSIIVIVVIVLGIFESGKMIERNERKTHYKNLSDAQVIDTRNKWASRMNDSTVKLVLDNVKSFINN